MNRRIVSGVCICLALIAAWAGFAGYTQRDSVIIHLPIDKVAPLFTHINKWNGWHPDFINQKINTTLTKSGKEQQAKLNDLTYLLRTINPVKVHLFKVQESDTAEAILSAAPYHDGSYTYVEYTTRQSGFAWLQEQFKGNSAQSLLQGLQSFAEDESRRYGFSIQTVPVADTLILTTSITTVQDSAIKAIAVLYDKLQLYCKQNSLTPKNYYYVSTVALADGSMQVSAGVPVPEQNGAAEADFAFLKLPLTGRLVAGEYKGRYKDKQQLYAAMDEYVQDKHMKKVAQPLERYEAANTPLSDSTVVFMRLYYPVF